MKKDRLLYLAQALRKNAKNKKGAKFDLSSWVGTLDEAKPLSCGTTACAFGLATLLPKFRKMGLKLGTHYPRGMFHPFYRGEYDTNAAMSFFDITNAEAEALFMPNSYPPDRREKAAGELLVAARIEYFVNGGDIVLYNKHYN